MLNMRARLHEDAGFSLVELLIAMLLATVVGGVAVSGIVGGLQQSARTQDRIDAFNELQLAVERMSREVRAADPIVNATPNRIEVHVRRDGACSRFIYELTGGELRGRQDRSTNDCASFTNGTPTRMVTDVDPSAGPLFTYQTSDGAPTTTVEEMGVVSIDILRALPDQPSVSVGTVVNIRNS